MSAFARSARPRGQATVEAVLGLIVFVTVLILGIHFAEVGFLSLKVQEATAFALWDVTARPMHALGQDDWSVYRGSVSEAGAAAQARYGRSTVRQVFTRAHPVTVHCDSNPGVSGVSPADAAVVPDYARPFSLASAMSVDGSQGVACSARATLTGFHLPRAFLDGQLFSAPHYQAGPLTVCAPSRDCGGRVVMLLDDWGLSDLEDARECPLAREGGTGCENQGYYDWVRRAYESNNLNALPHTAGSDLYTAVTGQPSPIQETHFYMSFRGSESGYTEDVGRVHGGSQARWETTPYRQPPGLGYDVTRAPYWLGKPL